MPKTPFSDDFSGFLRISTNVVQIPLKTQLIYAHRAENEQSNSLSTALQHLGTTLVNPNQTLDYLKLAMRALIMNIPVELVELILLSE